MSSASIITSTITSTITAVSASAVILPPPPQKPALKLCVRIIPVGRSYPYVLPVAYCLRYTSTLPTYLGTLAV